MQEKARQRRTKLEVRMFYAGGLFDTGTDGSKVIVPAPEQPVQLAMFAL